LTKNLESKTLLFNVETDCGISTIVQQSTHNPMFKGSKSAAVSTRGNKYQKEMIYSSESWLKASEKSGKQNIQI
jgi:hypothetical protein